MPQQQPRDYTDLLHQQVSGDLAAGNVTPGQALLSLVDVIAMLIASDDDPISRRTALDGAVDRLRTRTITLALINDGAGTAAGTEAPQ